VSPPRFQLAPLDWAIIGIYFVFVLGIGFVFKRRAERHGLESFVLSDRNLPWWLIGTSMVASTFSAETPLLVANWVYESGISRNWEWWCFLPGAMLTTFLFARLWRRTEVLTDAEYVTLRYSGREAQVLRAFRALYMGFVMNTIVIGSALLVSGLIGTTLLGIGEDHPHYQAYRLGIALSLGLVAMVYSSMAGIAGIVVNDFVQFSLAMLGAVLIAVYAVGQPEVGGLSGLVAAVVAREPRHLEFLPAAAPAEAGRLTLGTVALFLSVRWWAQVYGGAEPGGASHVAQRMLSARSEQDAVWGTLWFNIAHYAVRPWPWILTGLAGLILFPNVAKGEQAYILSINLVPAGLKGLVLAGFFSALMAIDTRLNMGAAYLVNDFYRPFLVRNASDAHYVLVSRLVTVVQLLVGVTMLFLVTRVKSIFFITTALGSGTGLVFLLRWYWWRVSAWSEIAAMSAGLLNLAIFRLVVYPDEATFNAHGPQILVVSTVAVSAVWLAVTLLTPPPELERLKTFYRRVRPAGPFWGPVAAAVREADGPVDPGYRIGPALVSWAAAITLVYSALFGTGKSLLGQPTVGAGLLALGLAAWGVLAWSLRLKEHHR
jgi:solute:Na+ symporter, SSS family